MLRRFRQTAVATLILAQFIGGDAVADTVKPQPTNPQSVRFAELAGAQLVARQPSTAADLYESALAADPQNVAAYVGLGRAYEALGLPGKALGYYREALTIDPNNLAALEAQGSGLASKGFTQQAQAVLDRIRKLCRSECPPAHRLASTVAAAVQKNVQAGTTAAAPAPPAQPGK